MRRIAPAGPYERVARELAPSAFASIEYVEETESTNADAAALLEKAPLRGHTIVAEYQRRGAGRKGRTWLAPAGTALLCTTILPRIVDTPKLWIVPFWTAIVARNALGSFGVTTTLQWPNDLLLGDRKIAGVLCHSSVSGIAARVACGVGINVRRPGADPGIDPAPAFCDDVAEFDRTALLEALLREYERTLAAIDSPQHISEQWDEGARLPGRLYRIQLDADARPFEAIAEGLALNGGLRVIRHDGRRETVSLADARVLR